MGKILYTDLIKDFKEALEQEFGYILGTSGQNWTRASYDDQVKRHSGDSDYNLSIQYGQKWIGHKVSDCSGLFVWAYKRHGKTIYHGSNSIWSKNVLSAKGEQRNGYRTDGKTLLPGTAVFKYNPDPKKRYYHIGLYIGEGKVIEAQGSKTGVVQSKIKSWTHWGELKDVNYENTVTIEIPITTGGDAMYTAKITSQDGKSVNVRKRPSTDSDRIIQLPVGTIVSAEQVNDTWSKVELTYRGRQINGYIKSEFLAEAQIAPGSTEITGENQPNSSSTVRVELDIEAARSLVNALKNAGISG